MLEVPGSHLTNPDLVSALKPIYQGLNATLACTNCAALCLAWQRSLVVTPTSLLVMKRQQVDN